MADATRPKADKTAAEGRPSQSGAPDKPEVTRYDHEYLISHARALLRSDGSIVAGALADQKKTLTLEEAEAAVTAYLKRPVQVEE